METTILSDCHADRPFEAGNFGRSPCCSSGKLQWRRIARWWQGQHRCRAWVIVITREGSVDRYCRCRPRTPEYGDQQPELWRGRLSSVQSCRAVLAAASAWRRMRRHVPRWWLPCGIRWTRVRLGGLFSLSLPLAENPWGFPESNRTNEQKAVLAPRNLVLYQSEAGSDGKVTHDALWKFSEDDYFSGKQLIDPISNNGKAQLDLALLTKGGFGSWYLSNRGDIGFKGTIDAVVPNQLVLSADRFSANSADVSISLTAGALKLGNAYDAGIKPKANADDPNEILLPSVTTGLASATFSAKDIGIFGVVGWSGFADTKFESSGAIHFDGVLNSVPFRTGGRTLWRGVYRYRGFDVFCSTPKSGYL